jgi:hypothetical protein
VFVDAILLNQGAISLIAGVYLIFVAMPRASLARRYAGARKKRLLEIGVYLGAVALVFALNAANNEIAARRADRIIVAVEKFHSKTNRFPSALSELVPEFIKRVPLAKYTLGFNSFEYIQNQTDPLLLYVATPPFGRPTYSFARRTWAYID